MTWYLRNSDSAGAPDYTPFQYGGIGWRVVAGDWTGQGASGIGVFDPSSGAWYLRDLPSSGAPTVAPFPYGGVGWLPVVGQWTASPQVPASSRQAGRDGFSADWLWLPG
jgi:hypothetical protein